MNKKTTGLAAVAALAVASAAVLFATLQTTEADMLEEYDIACTEEPCPQSQGEQTNSSDASWWSNVHSNVRTDFNANVTIPAIEPDAFIHPFAVIIGDCHIGNMVFVAPTAVCRGDEGTPIYVGDGSNIQDGVVIHALETISDGNNIDDRRFSVGGERLKGSDESFSAGYAVYIGNNTSLAHGSMVHGPAWVGHNTFIGMEALVFNAKVGNNVAVGVSATITGGVEIADGKFVPPGAVIMTQEDADALPQRLGSAYESTNKAVIHVNQQLAEGYDSLDLERLMAERESAMEEDMLETSMPHP